MPKKTVESVLETGNHLLVQVKGNQPTLQALAREVALQPPCCSESSDTIGRRNRIEQRIVKVWPLPADFGAEPWHRRFRTLVQVERRVERFQTKTAEWQTSEEVSLYLSDLLHNSTHWGDVIRRHWHIENRLHWVRDETLGEDRGRIRCNPGIFALLRSFALNTFASTTNPIPATLSTVIPSTSTEYGLTEESSIEQPCINIQVIS
jgi:predicted transposase YbfD/YdcC